MLYDSKRRHGSSDQAPPTEYENNIINGPEASILSVVRGASGFTRLRDALLNY